MFSKIVYLNVDKTIRLVIFYNCDPSLSLREDRELKVSENIVFRKMFRLKRREESGKLMMLHKEELRHLHS